MKRLLTAIALLLSLAPLPATAQDTPGPDLTRFGQGAGPTEAEGVYRLLDGEKSKSQSNAIAFARRTEGPFGTLSLRCKMRVLEGGDGGAFVFLNTAEYGVRGPAPFVKSWVEPNLAKTFSVGIDVHNPKNEEPFGDWGNYQGLPEREVSLHWDGREIVKRVAPEEFRGDFADVEIQVEHVVGGADVTVRIGEAKVYDKYFIAHMMPYESRLAVGAGTRADATTEFDVKDVVLEAAAATGKRRPPVHFEVFHHVLTDNSKTAFDTEVSLPPPDWAFGRVILTLDIHDAGKSWDEWDRNGEISIWDADGVKRGVVPFITSYRTECHWKVDVTHFRPFLTGKVKFEVRAGTTFYKNRGYQMSVALDFHHGRPEIAPFRVVPLWHGTAKYKSAENHFQDFFEPQAVTIPAETQAARIFVATTGHSQVGEFTPSMRTIVFAPQKGGEVAKEMRFQHTLWKNDCYLNPNRPQYGTWKYSRAGWAPGDVVRPWWINLTPYLAAGKEAEFRWEPSPYDLAPYGDKPPSEKELNKASHVVRSYLILYREPTAMVAAPTLLIANVVGKSNAAKAGIKQGDYLASYEGEPIDTVAALGAAIKAAEALGKEKVVVVVFRGSERLELELDPGRMGVNLRAR